MKKTYRIEREIAPNVWSAVMTWYGMLKSRTDGAMMVLDSMYSVGGSSPKYRAICEQTGEVYMEVGGRGIQPKQNIYTESQLRINTLRDVAKKFGVIIISARQNQIISETEIAETPCKNCIYDPKIYKNTYKHVDKDVTDIFDAEPVSDN